MAAIGTGWADDAWVEAGWITGAWSAVVVAAGRIWRNPMMVTLGKMMNR